MPTKSSGQYGLMAGVMSGSIKNSGIPHAVAKEMVHRTPAKKRKIFAKHLRSNESKKVED